MHAAPCLAEPRQAGPCPLSRATGKGTENALDTGSRALIPCPPMSQIDPVVVEREVLQRLDPKGEMVELLDAFAPLVDARPGQGLLRLLRVSGFDLTELEGPITQARELVADMAQAVVLFTPLSWAPLSRAPMHVYREALRVYQRTGSTDEAEQRLLDGWNQDDWLRHAVMPLQAVGAGHDELYDVLVER
jgi:hypothetical protein